MPRIRSPVVLAATEDFFVIRFGVGLFDSVGGNHQRGNARTSHASRAGHGLVISPRSVRVLTAFPISLGQAPRSVAYRHSGALGLMQAQQGELTVGVVAAAVLRIRPCSFIGSFQYLYAFQPPHIAADKQEIFLWFGPGENHRLQSGDVRTFRLELAEIVQCLLNLWIVRLNPGIQEGQCTKGTRTPRIAGIFVPRTINLLLLLF